MSQSRLPQDVSKKPQATSQAVGPPILQGWGGHRRGRRRVPDETEKINQFVIELCQAGFSHTSSGHARPCSLGGRTVVPAGRRGPAEIGAHICLPLYEDLVQGALFIHGIDSDASRICAVTELSGIDVRRVYERDRSALVVMPDRTQ